MGRIPTVLKTARQMNHGSCPLRALFHMAISFQTPSQMARTMIAAMISAIIGVFMEESIIANDGRFIF